MTASSFVSKFDGAVSELPLMEIVRYKDSNLKMAANEFRVRVHGSSQIYDYWLNLLLLCI